MVRLTAWILRHRAWVVLFWLLIAVTGGALASKTVDRLSYDFALPGQPAYEANQDITRLTKTGGTDDPLVLIARGDTAAQATQATAAFTAALPKAVPGTRVAQASDDGLDALAQKGSTARVLVLYPPVVGGAESYAAAQPRLTALAKQVQGQTDGATLTLTGFTDLSEGGAESGTRGVLVEVVLGGLGALVVLALVFGSLLAGVPLLVAAVSILGTFLALLGLTALTDVVFVVQYLVALIGLGVAIDYSLLLVTRWREERAIGMDDDEAIASAMATAGRSVLFSGITVAVSLAALVLVPLPFLRSIGLGGLLIPLLSVATTLTLVPALLSAVGPRLLWPRRHAPLGASRFWTRVSRGVLHRRWLVIVLSTGALLAIASPVLGIRLGSPQLSAVSASGPSASAVRAVVEDGVPAGFLRPVQVLAPAGKADDAAARLADVRGVAAASAPATTGWAADGQRLVLVLLAQDPASDAGGATLQRVRDTVAADDLGRVGGSAAEDADFVSAVYGDAVWVVLAVIVVTFVLLARALSSFWLPVKALVLNVVSIAAAYGVTVWVWQDGHGSELLFNQPASGAVTTWVPVAAFAFLFGLSMDYEVFILSRMRESYDLHGDTPRAVVDGIAHTGRLVTSAALILFLAFVALSTVPSTDVKILATTLALGIVIDAVVVRSLLAPALVGVLGHANWSMPRWLRAALRVRQPHPPSHLAEP